MWSMTKERGEHAESHNSMLFNWCLTNFIDKSVYVSAQTCYRNLLSLLLCLLKSLNGLAFCPPVKHKQK